MLMPSRLLSRLSRFFRALLCIKLCVTTCPLVAQTYAVQQPCREVQALLDKGTEAETDIYPRWQVAVDCYDKAYQNACLYKDIPGKATALERKGHALIFLGKDQQALDTYSKALVFACQLTDLRGAAFIHYNIGIVYTNLAENAKKRAAPAEAKTDSAKAEANFIGSLKLRKNLKASPETVMTLNALGNLYTSKERFDQALGCFSEALKCCAAVNNKQLEAVIWSSIAFAYIRQQKPSSAWPNYQKALAIYGNSYSDEGDTLSQGIMHQDRYFRSVHVVATDNLWRLRRGQEALALYERGRCTGLAQLAARVRLPVLLGESDANAWEKKNTDLLLIAAQVKLLENIDLPTQEILGKLDAMRRQRRDLENQRTELKQRLLVAHPKFARLFASYEPTDGALKKEYNQLRSALIKSKNQNTLFVEYVTLYDSLVLVFAFSKQEELKVFRLDRNALSQQTLESRVSAWRRRLAGVLPEAENQTELRNLSNLLLGPLYHSGLMQRGHYQSLVIVGDGPLLDVPFAALLTPNGHRLVERYALSTPFSLTSLIWPLIERPANDNLLAVANPATGQDDLPQAEAQARKLQEQFDSGLPLIGANATKEAVLQRMETCRVLHFGLHGTAIPSNGLYSYLSLAPGGNKGQLTAAEIMQHPLSAQLAVLSACETLQGSKLIGEGLVGLAWAFRAAGCPAIVATQWKIPQGPSVQLTDCFYAGLRKGLRKDLALQQAMLAVMRQLEYAAPVNWAAFQLIGNTDPLHLAPMNRTPRPTRTSKRNYDAASNSVRHPKGL
jgi:CHAT domain-containing protein